MPKKMVGQKTTLWLIDPGATDLVAGFKATPKTISLEDFEDALALTAADSVGTTGLPVGGALNITDAVVSGYTLNPTASDTVESTSVGDEGNGQQRGLGNYEADFEFFRDTDTTKTLLFNRIYNFFVRPTGGSDKEFWIARRFGYRKNTPLAVGHELEVFHLNSELHTRVTDDNKGEPILLHVPAGSLGTYVPFTAVTA